MHPERLAEWLKLVEHTEDPLDRADLGSQMAAEWWGSYGSPIDDFVSREMWQRVLAAHVQPLPDAAD